MLSSSIVSCGKKLRSSMMLCRMVGIDLIVIMW